jgi:hypothetical protein
MTGPQWLVWIGTAVTSLFTWLLLIDAVARGRPRGKCFSWRQRTAGFRRVFRNRKRVPCLAPTEGGG